MSEAQKLPPQLLALSEKVDQLIFNAKEKDRTAVKKLIMADAGLREPQEVTPVMAAIVIKEHNGHNRDFRYAKALGYAQAMERDEWKLTHQGIAFYENGDIADGQHRFAAIVLSGKSQKFDVKNSFPRDAYDVIDIGGGRNPKDTLQLSGVEDAGIKAAIIRIVMQYEHRQKTGRQISPTPTEVQIFERENTELLSLVVDRGRKMIQGCPDAPMSTAETATAALLLLRGGWPQNVVFGYLSSIQLGVANHDGAVAIDLSRQFAKSRHSEKRTAKLDKISKLALICKGVELHVHDKSVARPLRWDRRKEELPAPTPPAGEVFGDISKAA